MICLEFRIWNLGFGVTMYPVVDEEKCNGCGNCAEICPSEVYQVEKDKSEAIRPEDCIECWACVTQCPTESIRLHED